MRRNMRTRSQLPKRLTGGALAILLAVGLGSSSAYAYENVAAAAQDQTVKASTHAEGNKAGLLPGDLLYFIKTIYEQIRLALSSDDVKEAQLLAEFAQIRLSEANALLVKGKVAEAKQSIQKSLETQQSAVEKTEQASGTFTADTYVTPTSASEKASVEPSQSAAGKRTSEKKEVTNKEKILTIKTDLQRNIAALADVLEKVENPNAQIAIMKNIEKSFAHLEEKLEKIERKKETEPVLQTVKPASSQVVNVAEAPSDTRDVQENAAEPAAKDGVKPVKDKSAHAEAQREKTKKLEKTENRDKEDKKDKQERPAIGQRNNDNKGENGGDNNKGKNISKHNDNNGNRNK
ncbi:hypothetical protein PAECIP111802_02157 [Paenibacillus allorhizosphaerae]|uniref:DUF5667 domain-containing protein n=2 Tax=Paenibacillus allorhizosphaerae TaxID=2849866 RepID=A0ABM8VFM5_9BACL|nr:hypothetical protein PAECIP111802_02157 [Paenibacillus allorhizosphaerae]